jgi:hypothetical protein
MAEEQTQEKCEDSYLVKALKIKDKNMWGEPKDVIADTLITILERAKRFRKKIYTPTEINDIFEKRGIRISPQEVVDRVCSYPWFHFSECLDKHSDLCYELVHENAYDAW